MSLPLDVDRNLLFAVIALQDDLIDQTQFTDVCAGWAVRLERSLPELLLERGWITAQDRADIERKLERKLKKHQGDVRATLGAVADIEARDALRVIKNPRVAQSLGGLAPRGGTSWSRHSSHGRTSVSRCATPSPACMPKGGSARSGSPTIPT